MRRRTRLQTRRSTGCVVSAVVCGSSELALRAEPCRLLDLLFVCGACDAAAVPGAD